MNFIKKQKYRILSLIIILLVGALGYFYLYLPEYQTRILNDKNKTKEQITLNNKKPNTISLGLDLVGGSQLVYDADISKIKTENVKDSMNSLKQILEKRLNPFGVSEAQVFVEGPSVFTGDENKTRRVTVQIPGVQNPDDAKKLIGKIPTLEFAIIDGENLKSTGLTGRYLKTSRVQKSQQTSKPIVTLEFNEEGGKKFGEITEKNVGKQLAILLDGNVISAPKINAPIHADSAIIEGNFGLKEAQELANNLKFGALPVSIKLVSSNTISASLGSEVLTLGLKAAFYSLIFVSLFLIYFYRFSGFVASLALISYTIITLSIFKLFGFVFTSAGIAGFIISIGMAVDANVLIFERIKEELKNRRIKEAIKEGFKRAWLSIRDGNLSSIFTAIILFYTATSLIKGFSLTFGIGVISSMFSAIFITRIFLLSFVGKENSFNIKKYLFGNFKK